MHKRPGFAGFRDGGPMSEHNIPVLSVTGRTLAQAYEQALVALYKSGLRIKTQYDNPDDPPSLDATMDVTVLEPEADPMIHRAFPAGIEDLKEYVMELEGCKDHWVKNINDPEDTRWEYTYHGRLAAYGVWRELVAGKSEERGGFKVDQIAYIIDKLVAQPFTRQAQAVTWMPNLDPRFYDPPCLQSLWYRIIEDQAGVWWLNCNIRFRSNDAWKASFMNMFGFIQFNREIVAAGIAERTNRSVLLGRLNWHADSYHIYGKDLAAAEQMLFSRLDTMKFEERVFNFGDEFIREMYDGAETAVREKIRAVDEERMRETTDKTG
jgi:thymidylate synthase